MSIRGIIAGICLGVLSGNAAHSQYLEISADFDTNQVRIGELFHLDLAVEQPVGLSVDFPVIRDTLVDKVEVLESHPADTVVSDEVLQISKRYTLTSFDSGLYQVPPLLFHFRQGDWKDSLGTYPLYLLVHTVAVDSSIYDVKSPIHMPVGFMEVFPYLIGGLALVVCVGILIWYIRKRRSGKPVFLPEKPAEPAHVIALRELNVLQEQKLWQQNEFKKYYTRLTEVIRRYMERRYNIPAMEMTSHETLQAWSASGEDREDLTGSLRSLLNLADLVKFAKEKPLATDNEENLERAFDFVHKTKWMAPEPDEKAEE